MKKIILIVFAIFSLVSCGDDVQFNTPALQANKDGELWRALIYEADIDTRPGSNGYYVIQGRNGLEFLQLITNTDNEGTYELGLEGYSAAIYVDEEGTIYSTKFAPDPSLTVYPPEGQIIIDNVDNNNPKVMYGTFWFYAYSEDGFSAVNFNRGVFYKVPLIGGNLEPIIPLD